MQRILSALGQVFRKCILVLGLMSLISLSSLFISVGQSYLAVAADQDQAPKAIDVLDYTDKPAASREEAYDEAIKAAESPEKVEKAEEKEIKAFKSAQSGKGVIGGAQDLLNRVTGNKT